VFLIYKLMYTNCFKPAKQMTKNITKTLIKAHLLFVLKSGDFTVTQHLHLVVKSVLVEAMGSFL